MGAIYAVGGQRFEWRLFLDHNGRYERTIRQEPAFQCSDMGRWEYDETENLLQLLPDNLDEKDHRMGRRWRILSVNSCEDSNVMLVLREAILGSRNLPILLYRVHNNGRGYGTDWERRLPATS